MSDWVYLKCCFCGNPAGKVSRHDSEFVGKATCSVTCFRKVTGK